MVYKRIIEGFYIASKIKRYAHFAWGLRGFFRHRISIEQARAIVEQRLVDREDNFLRLVERGIFGHRKSPYLHLLKQAGCEMSDIRDMVRTRGLENTLLALREAGVYVTFEEFKGREPIVRNGKIIPIQVRDFDNPYLRSYYEATSGGTTGMAARASISLDHTIAQNHSILLSYDAHSVLNLPTAIWYGILPDSTGMENILRGSLFGNLPWKWFSPVVIRDSKASLKEHLGNLGTHYIILMGRLLNVHIPFPEYVSLDQAAVVAHWAANVLKTHGQCLIRANVSMAMRICIAAREEGLDLTGVTLMGGGEPPTPAKVAEIIRSGARWVPNYWFTEAGVVGWGCAKPVDPNDIHIFKDAIALIQYPRQVNGLRTTVDAFHFTTLLPTAPKLLLNVESDDYGVIEKRSCGCPLETYGYTEHLRHIRSFCKITGEGVTLIGSEMIQILEEVLPTRFGGSPFDYQLLEEEDEKGFTKVSLLVSPRVGIIDEKKVIETVLEALGKNTLSVGTRAIWSQARTLQIKRMAPVWTSRGKLMPLHLARLSKPSTAGKAAGH